MIPLSSLQVIIIIIIIPIIKIMTTIIKIITTIIKIIKIIIMIINIITIMMTLIMIFMTPFSSLQSSAEGEEEEAGEGGMNPQRVKLAQVEVDLEVEDIVHLEVDMVDLVVDLEVWWEV